MADPVYLRYIGKGHSLHGIPARDLTEIEARRFDIDNLLDSGLYQLADPPKPEVKTKSKTFKPDVGVDIQEGD